MKDGWNELIERITEGEVGLDDPSVHAALQDDAFVDALEEHFSLLSELDQGAVLAEARSQPSSPVEAQIRALVAQRLQRRHLPALPAIIAALAAGLLFAVFGPRWFGGAPSEPTVDDDVPAIVLGSGELTCVAPIGDDADFSVFRWSHDATGGVYSVAVYNGTDGEELATWGPGAATFEWRPDPDQLAEWPARIEWQLTWTRPGSNESESTFALATRRE